jgi:uncharacterized protein YndB with AHSA1/START domain
MKEIRHELKMHAVPERIFHALTDKAALERWHGARVSGGPHEWTLAYPDGPSFRWKVVSATPQQVTWRCEEGPGNSKGTDVSFTLSDADKGRTLVQLVHRGWTESDAKFAKCNTFWAVLLGRLQQEAEGFQVTKR